MKSFLLFTGIFAFAITGLMAQRFAGDKPSVKWKQINQPTVRVIYPKGLDSTADRVADIVEKLSKITLPTIGTQLQKIDIVLHPNTIISNGYVALGPFRSEFYLSPSQNSFDLGSIPWHDLLAIHEYRHVQQYNNFNTGLSKVFSILFGQSGQELANALAIPNWFFEGDAVFQETLVSEQGRGRLPFFFNDYKSLWKADKKYSYLKLRNGSLRDFTPDHYRLGYMMVAYGREKYGPDIWNKVSQDAAAFKGLFYPFQRAVKKYTGTDFASFNKNALNFFKEQDKSISGNPGKLSLARHFQGDQVYPAYVDDETMVYVKSTYSSIPRFMLKKGLAEKSIRVRDVSIDNQFSYRNRMIVYAAYRPAARWSWNDYSELQVLNLETGVQKTITHNSKYFSPDISDDGKTILAVRVQPDSMNQLQLLDAGTGAILKTLPNPENLFYSNPKFINDNVIIAAIRKPGGEMALQVIDIARQNASFVSAPCFRVLGNPVVQGDTVYFSAANQEEDQLFAITLSNKKIFLLSVNPDGIGIYQPAVSKTKICFTSFTAYGYRLQEYNKSSVAWKEISMAEWMTPIATFGINLQTPTGSGVLSQVPNHHYQSSRYPTSVGFFNFHSLLPYVSDPDYTLSLVGNNVLNNMQSELFVSYNRNEQYKELGFNGTYGGWFPHLNLAVNYIVDRKDRSIINKPLDWNEGQFSGGLKIPLNLSRGRQLTGLSFGADYAWKAISFKGLYKDSLKNYQLGYINSYLSFSNQTQQARQHIYPHFAQTFYFNYRNAVETVTANQLLLTGSLYWPGFAKNHSFVISLAYQTRDTLRQYSFSNSFPFSRGYQSPNLRSMVKWGINYHFPVAYPDAGLGGIIYFQRIRANLFYDNTTGLVAYTNGARLNTQFNTIGSEIFFDTKWWNELPINFGIRYSHLLNPDLFGGAGSERFELVLPVNLFQR